MTTHRPSSGAAALGIALAALLGCRTGDPSDDSRDCEDALCYPLCKKWLIEDFPDDDYMIVRLAYCADNESCKCNFGCDDEACAYYCLDEAGIPEGRCDNLSCVCGGNPDAGDAG